MFFSPSSSSSFFSSNRFSMKAVRSMLPHNTRFLWVGWKSIHRRAPLHTRCVCDTTERGGVAIERGTGILVETSIAFEPPSARAEEKFKVSLFLLSLIIYMFFSPLSLSLSCLQYNYGVCVNMAAYCYLHSLLVSQQVHCNLLSNSPANSTACWHRNDHRYQTIVRERGGEGGEKEREIHVLTDYVLSINQMINWYSLFSLHPPLLCVIV